jgi:hypothetical protein
LSSLYRFSLLRLGISGHIYNTIDGSNLPLTADQNVDPVSVETSLILPSSPEDFSRIPMSDGSKHQPFVDFVNRPPFLGDQVKFPCVVAGNS